MRKAVVLLAIILVGFCFIFSPADAQERKNRGVSISTGTKRDITDCSQLTVRFGYNEASITSLQQTVPASAISSLRIKTSRNGGVQVHGWSRGDYEITACVAAAGDDANEAKALVDQLKLSVKDGNVTVEGPRPEDWIAFLIVQAPNGAVLDLSSINGPIGVSGFSGTVQAHNLNGPVTFRDVNGQVRADVQNGPITVSGSGGDFRLTAQNGPLTIALNGNHWSGGELEGSTQNGPVTLKLPDGYQTSVRVDASRHSPVTCKAVQCQQAVRTWDRPSVIQFGDQPPVIRLSTVNGPVTITSAGDAR